MTHYQDDDTIAAIATPFGEGGLAVIRVSGPEAFGVVCPFFHPHKGINLSEALSHTLHLGKIRNKEGKLLDQAVVSIFRAPHSYTGEDVLEISLHGGMVVTRTILDLLITEGARPAQPGEFTRRAFLNQKIDLTQAEAVLDLIQAKSEKSLDVAVRQLAGSLSRKFKEIKKDILLIYAHVEAYLDFPDMDLEIYQNQELLGKLTTVLTELKKMIDGFARGSLFREGISMVIVGKPNAGKSSLFNTLLARDRALVSEIPGTTRDHIEEAVEIGGFYIRLIDTAGLGLHNPTALDQLGIERTHRAIGNADLCLCVTDGSQVLSQADEAVFALLDFSKPVLGIMNKSDLGIFCDEKDFKRKIHNGAVLKISTKTRDGIEALEKTIAEILNREKIEASEEQITRLRHRKALEKSFEALTRAENALRNQLSLEFLATDMKSALDEMAELIGETYSEDLLDVIFSEFCIGK